MSGEMSGKLSGDSFGHSGCARVRMRRTRAKPLVNAGPTASATFFRSLLKGRCPSRKRTTTGPPVVESKFGQANAKTDLPGRTPANSANLADGGSLGPNRTTPECTAIRAHHRLAR